MWHIYSKKSIENKKEGGGSIKRIVENNLKLVYPYLILYNIKFKSLKSCL